MFPHDFLERLQALAAIGLFPARTACIGFGHAGFRALFTLKVFLDGFIAERVAKTYEHGKAVSRFVEFLIMIIICGV